MNFSVQSELKVAYRHYYARFYQYVTKSKKVFDPQLAEEIVTKAFTKVMRKENVLGDKCEMNTFLRGVIDETCEEYTSISRKPPKEKSIEEFDISQIAPASEENDFEEEFMKLVWNEIDKLPVQRRRILRKLFLHGLTSKQVAEEMRLSRQTVINQKVKAFHVLRKIFSRYLFF